jgi:hypothetical protein
MRCKATLITKPRRCKHEALLGDYCIMHMKHGKKEEENKDRPEETEKRPSVLHRKDYLRRNFLDFDEVPEGVVIPDRKT